MSGPKMICTRCYPYPPFHSMYLILSCTFLSLTPPDHLPFSASMLSPTFCLSVNTCSARHLERGWARHMTPCSSTLCCLLLTPSIHVHPSDNNQVPCLFPILLTIVFFAECNSPMAQDPDIVLLLISFVPSLSSWSVYLCHSARTN